MLYSDKISKIVIVTGKIEYVLKSIFVFGQVEL